jgi:DNA-binding NtrC family response regulator
MLPSTVTREMRRFLTVPTLVVDVLEGPDAGTSVNVDREVATVGSAAGNDLVLRDETVSRYHLELVRLERGVRVVDLGSTNGTFIAGVQLERGVVQPGTVIEIGTSKLRLRGGEEAMVELHGGDALGALRGRTEVMRRLMARVLKIAASEVAVLLVGESGTGKELIARALHEHSRRAGGRFVTMDCGAMAPHLVASELFGHERGAFTGADAQRNGAFELAHGGTLFLDEVGELPADLQSYLLGALERRTFRRVGGRDDIRVDVRVVSATNRDLRAEVNAGNFRLDLYYRLAATALEVPPLRERTADIPMLIEHFIQEHGSAACVGDVAPPEIMHRLAAHRWPGNVRELRNLVAVSLAMGEALELGDDATGALAAHDPLVSDSAVGRLATLPYRQARTLCVREFERLYLKTLLERSGGNVSNAAREAGMNRSHLSELLHRHRLR